MDGYHEEKVCPCESPFFALLDVTLQLPNQPFHTQAKARIVDGDHAESVRSAQRAAVELQASRMRATGVSGGATGSV